MSFTGKPGKVLACNGMTEDILASCDVLDLNTQTWKHHSYPNKAHPLMDRSCDSSYPGYSCKTSPDRKKDRYTANVVIAGGMIFRLKQFLLAF